MADFIPADQYASQMGGGVDPANEALMQALTQIRQTQAQPLMSTHPLAQLDAATQGAYAAYRGEQNPAIAQALAVRQQQLGSAQQGFQNQLGLTTMRRQMDVATAEIQNKKEDNLLNIADKLGQQDDDVSRRVAANVRATILKGRGVILPPDFVEQASSKKISKAALDNSATLLTITNGDVETVSKSTGLTPTLLMPMWKAILTGDERVMKALGLEAPTIIQSRMLEMRKHTQEILLNEFKINDPHVGSEANLVAVKEFGVPFAQLDAGQRKYVAQRAMEFLLNRDQQKAGLPPVPAETARLLSGMENVEGDLQKAIKNYRDNKGKLGAFVGPALSGAPIRNWLATNMPEAATAGGELAMPPELVSLKNSLVRTRNVFLNARSGQAVTENELKRMLEELPTLSDNPSVFEQKLQMTAANQTIVVKRLQALSGVGGRERVNPAAVILDNPMPERQEIKRTVPFSRKKERDGSITIVPERE